MSTAIRNNIQNSFETHKNIYGEDFCNVVDTDLIEKIPEISAEKLPKKLLSGPLSHNLQSIHFQGYSAIRGVDETGRPFIAFRLEALDREGQKVAEVIEAVVRRNNGEYFSTHFNKGDDGCHYPSALCSIKKLDKKHFKGVKKLLKGRTIQPINEIKKIYRAPNDSKEISLVRPASRKETP